MSRNPFAVFLLSIAVVWSDAQADVERPNVVMVVVDDMRVDEYGAGGHPYLRTPSIDRLAAEGATFTQAYHATPLCSPNRASLLTGQYSSRHGILDNTSRSHASHRLSLFPIELQKAGYRTAHVGKWHMGNDPTPRPGYDYWVSFAGQGRTMDPILFEDGEEREVEGYITDIFTDRAIEFIERNRDRPFFLYVGHKAIHPDAKQLDDGSLDPDFGRRFMPAPRHRDAYANSRYPLEDTAGLSADEAREKPVLAAAIEEKRSPETRRRFGNLISYEPSQDEIRDRARMMMSVDEGIGRILTTLEDSDLLDKTLVIVTSDNGYFFGEHGLTVERRMPYQEAARAPLLMRYPPLIDAPRQIDALASSIDLAPTILAIAKVPVPTHVQGVSLEPVLRGETESVREDLLIEYHPHENPFLWTAELGYRAVIRDGFKYIKWLQHEDGEELYDLANDPKERHNLVDEEAQAARLRDMRQAMDRLVLSAMGLR